MLPRKQLCWSPCLTYTRYRVEVASSLRSCTVKLPTFKPSADAVRSTVLSSGMESDAQPDWQRQTRDSGIAALVFTRSEVQGLATWRWRGGWNGGQAAAALEQHLRAGRGTAPRSGQSSAEVEAEAVAAACCKKARSCAGLTGLAITVRPLYVASQAQRLPMSPVTRSTGKAVSMRWRRAQDLRQPSSTSARRKSVITACGTKPRSSSACAACDDVATRTVVRYIWGAPEHGHGQDAAVTRPAC